MRVNDHLRIGSITKTFTVTVLLQLVSRRTVALGDPISKYLPFVPNGKNITLRMLANMTAGLFNYTEDRAFNSAVFGDPHRVWKPRELVDVAFKHKPYFSPGTGFHYSNTNTVLLGMVIERVTRKRIGDVFRENIFRPLRLTNTVWPATSALPSPYARGYSEGADGKAVVVTNWIPSVAFTAGQIVSTVEDLKRWAKACATGAQVTAALQKERLTWVTLPPATREKTYALGIQNLHGWLGHNGSIPGYNSEAYYLPSQDATLVILTNSDITVKDMGAGDALFAALARIVTPGNAPT